MKSIIFDGFFSTKKAKPMRNPSSHRHRRARHHLGRYRPPTPRQERSAVPWRQRWLFEVPRYGLPSGKHTKNYGKSPFFMGNFTISMVIFHSYVELPEGIIWLWSYLLPICEPWCWYIYLHNWVILLGQMLVNIPYMDYMEHICYDMLIILVMILLWYNCYNDYGCNIIIIFRYI